MTKDASKRFITGRRRVHLVMLSVLASLTAGSGSAQPTGSQADQAAAIVDAMAEYDLRAVILRVTVDGREFVTAAMGESLTGVSATADMHFRNGAVAVSHMATLLLQLVDRG